jgi:hypothetical protein
MTDDLTRRLEAVERAVTDGHADGAALAAEADLADRIEAVEARLDAAEDRLADLDATTQALRGYLGGVDGVTADVERRADLALAKAEAVEAAVFEAADDGLAVERLPPDPGSSADPDHGDAAGAAGVPGQREPTGTTVAAGETEPTHAARTTGTTDPAGAVDQSRGRSIVERFRDAL